MRAWISDGLIRLAHRINPAAQVGNGPITYYINSSDPAGAADRLNERRRAARQSYLMR